MRELAVALVHYPVLDRSAQVVTTAITNLDVHDLARSAATFGAGPLFIVHPVAAQRALVERITAHWLEGPGGRRIPTRALALRGVRVASTLADALAALGPGAELWSTSAASRGGELTHDQARLRLASSGPPILLALGTGFGLAPEVLDQASAALAPIPSPRADGYNHLSVRAAGAILLHALLGARDGAPA